jgi:DNA-binding Lrp family transcriptional regulator
VRTTPEEKKRHYRTIFECVNENPRIKPGQLSKILGTRPSTARNRTQEAYDLGYIIGPHLRLKSYKNFKEYVSLVKCKNPLELYEKYIQDKNIIYHAKMDGDANLWIISKEKIDVEGKIIEGIRSDYHMSIPPDHSWDQAIKNMQEKVEDFDPEKCQSKEIIKNHWNEIADWNAEDEMLYREFKYDLRKPLEPVIKKHHIWGGKAYDWLKKLPQYCTITTSYFPESISQYDPYLFIVETGYEDFIIDLFSELPTSVLFFKVSDKLLIYAHVDRGSMRSVDFRASDISKLHIPFLMRDLHKRAIIKNEMHASVQCYWRENAEEP